MLQNFSYREQGIRNREQVTEIRSKHLSRLVLYQIASCHWDYRKQSQRWHEIAYQWIIDN